MWPNFYTGGVTRAWALSSGGLDTVRERRTGSGAPAVSTRERSDLVYDRDWDEEERLAEWRDVVKATDKLPALVAAAIAFDAWCRLAPLAALAARRQVLRERAGAT